MQIILELALLIAAVVVIGGGAIQLLLYFFDWLHGRRYPQDAQLARYVLRMMREKPEHFQVKSDIFLTAYSHALRIKADEIGGITVESKHLNRSALTESRTKREIRKIWKMQGRNDPAKLRVLENLAIPG